ncbi:MAG: COX15/CtaA family protein [Anaerolineales bacterium]|nr:COX15/CtaA family protein [Anaerolineales bacterium]
MTVKTSLISVAGRAGSGLPALALSAVMSTIVLILVGSIVRVTGNGLGCPDWPLCYGQAIPPLLHRGEWVEFSHRLVGLAASSQIVLVLVLAWRHHRDEKWVFRPALFANILLVTQIVLGGIHVILEIPPVTGWIHTGNAMLIVGLIAVVLAIALIRADWRPSALAAHGQRTFFGWLSAITAGLYLVLLGASFAVGGDASLKCPAGPTCAVTLGALRDLAALLSGLWLAAALANVIMATSAVSGGAASLLRGKPSYEWISWTTVAVYVLLLTGSYVTRSGASLVCPGFPLCGPAPAGMAALVNIQLLHRYTAYAVVALLLPIVYRLSSQRLGREVARFAHGLTVLLLLQVSLGAANILLKLPMWSRALHLTVGASIWVTVVMLWVAVTLGRGQLPRTAN